MRTYGKSKAKLLIAVTFVAALVLGPVLSIGRKAQASTSGPTFTTINYPGAVASFATDINDSGEIVGEYTFGNLDDRQGFLLSNGVFTSITFPGATFTRAVGINRFGDIVGDYSTKESAPNGQDFGYLLRGGVFTQVRFPNSDSTIAAGINANGDIVGWYLDKIGTHGFLLSGGVYTSIDFSGAAAFTQAWKINDVGEIAGRYVGTSDGKNHMFVLSRGSFTAVPDVPGALETAVVEDGGLNRVGHIVSQYCSSKPCALSTPEAIHGFLLSGGVYTTFDFPGATETTAFGLNSFDDIVGAYVDSSGLHGYLRTP
jgi:hypothetical protein